MHRLGSTAARLKLKEIDGGPHKRRSMWLNSMQREEPYPGLTCGCKGVKAPRLRGRHTGAAWLSSVRAVRCLVKSSNERNPCVHLAPARPATLDRLPIYMGGRWGRRQVSMALTSGAAHVLQWPVQRDAIPRGGANPESRPQFRLQSATRLHEVGFASNGASATAP